jgi:hypothetical protein
VFLDETAARTNLTRAYGRAPRGERCLASVPHGHWQTTTFIAGLRVNALNAPMVLDGPMDGPAFLAYVKTFLCPTLAPGDIVIADNLPSHKVAGVNEAIEAGGAGLRYLPPYSPDLNPSNTASPNSRHCSKKPRPAPSRPSGPRSETSSMPGVAQ